MKAYFNKYWKTIIVIVLIIVFLLSGDKGFKMYQGFLKEIESREDSIIKSSQQKQDSLLIVIDDGLLIAEDLQRANYILEQKNRHLYATLKKREQSLRVIDTSFMVNARRISKSSDRFYQRNDTVR